MRSMGVGSFEIEGGQENESRGPFRPMKFPEQVTLVKVEGVATYYCFALDTKGSMWKWGYRFTEDEKTNDHFEIRKISYLEQKGFRVLDFSAGTQYIILKVVDRRGVEKVLGMV